ncbi:nucleotidyl transferase AbiEii/AbiGii toxin family protein [Oceanicoccus sp. KOV_DT_Chl]|uniref:nucleotidyl transferase AbiEii/AbiGii toxin family protein n=1 Tax=Oceanicoccus sp. KOV_DT_Chl TaxID=1904639 RepID=UPI000C7DF6DC|nr:nucleotidyl transferase AbiEii/AbiGii toxin family protein [Oceanicoccus sp. KOV_DT_Chl]
MITKDEIVSVADETGLTPHVVEKDYVLGWLLAAVNANDVLSQAWVFKGGTCLKKCYFETYRFSEDLDFTLKDENQINQEFLLEQFGLISEWLYEESGIEIPIDRLVFDVYENPRGVCLARGAFTTKAIFPRVSTTSPKLSLI